MEIELKGDLTTKNNYKISFKTHFEMTCQFRHING
jgi:hypothetical protein